jgi:hypothetical protein
VGSHARKQDAGLHGPQHVIRAPGLERAEQRVAIVLAGQKDDGDRLRVIPRLDPATGLHAIHPARHQDVQQHQIEPGLGDHRSDGGQRLLTAFGDVDSITMVAQQWPEKTEVVRFVVDQQDVGHRVRPFAGAEGLELAIRPAGGRVGDGGHGLLLLPMFEQSDPGGQGHRQPAKALGLVHRAA